MTPEEFVEAQERARAANAQLLEIDSQIRQFEFEVRFARRRRRRAVLSCVFGPALLLVFYIMYWLPLSSSLLRAILIPGIPVSLACCYAAYHLLKHPGGPRVGDSRRRRSAEESELEIAKLRDTRKLKLADGTFPQKTRRIIYKDDAFKEIEKLRADSNRYRRINNAFQGILIVGSLAATAASGVASGEQGVRWAVLGVSLAVGIASGFMGYYKYKERSFYLQQTADSIEHEWEAFEVGVGRYKYCDTEEIALREFVEEVHRLKSEQRKREQNLEQPPDARDAHER
ncbi:DUF4231 domain-containing protein [Amycolatopsis thermoflava]|uniref:Uncharacterized protein DUF4231 n=1 Tax=Amycolatopsis thermoflava TaxID=84480 RepID=A0A3N2H6V7_9PSEU|nr:DUF4231 domain-containing protein [Amycolatopsis thermoflava]ROS44179.1 uncharacterized protein DUF4231 [Amycolatopsis thermoflava]